MIIKFFVPGDPKTAGSKRAFVVTPKGGGKPRAVVTDDAGKAGKDWRSDVRAQAQKALAGRPPLAGPLALGVTFYVRRPKHHYGSGGRAGFLKDSAPRRPIGVPDATKMLRAVEDAMLGLVYRDDSQIVVQVVEKRYAAHSRVGAEIEVGVLPLDAL